MKQWVYKATTSKVGYHETRHLAVTRHFLCRSGMESGNSQTDRAGEVALGDIIHFYYTHGGGKVPTFGSFVVVKGSEYPEQFGEQVEGTALFTVREDEDNADLIALLTRERERDPKRGYARDLDLNCFTGWVIRRLDSSEKTPPIFDHAKLFPGPMITLWPYPDPELPRKKKATAA